MPSVAVVPMHPDTGCKAASQSACLSCSEEECIEVLQDRARQPRVNVYLRTQEILRLIAEGLPVPEVARRMEIDRRTVTRAMRGGR